MPRKRLWCTSASSPPVVMPTDLATRSCLSTYHSIFFVCLLFTVLVCLFANCLNKVLIDWCGKSYGAAVARVQIKQQAISWRSGKALNKLHQEGLDWGVILFIIHRPYREGLRSVWAMQRNCLSLKWHYAHIDRGAVLLCFSIFRSLQKHFIIKS